MDTGKWLPGKKVLVDPRATDQVDWAKSSVHVHLTKDQIKNSPDLRSDGRPRPRTRPTSRPSSTGRRTGTNVAMSR